MKNSGMVYAMTATYIPIWPQNQAKVVSIILVLYMPTEL